MSLMRFDPFSDILNMRDVMNRFLEEGLTRPTGLAMGTRMLPIDMYEKDDEVYVRVAMPGAKPEDVDVTISGDTLTIRGQVLPELESKEVEQWDWYRHELPHGQFTRTINLPTRVSADKAEATFENGILTLRLPKSEETKPKRVSIQAQGQQQFQTGQGQTGYGQQQQGSTGTGQQQRGPMGSGPQGRA